MSLFFHKRANGIVNVKMVITEEKILSNIDKIQKLINPNSKKQIVKLEEDSYFKDLVESVKNYLLEYPKKNNFPTNVYSAAYGLVEYATGQFEENTKTVEDLIRKREKNIKLGSVLRDATKVVKAHAKNWKQIVDKLEPKYSADVAEALRVLGGSNDVDSDEYKKAEKLIDVKINNLESNIHIEIDMGRIEDRSKALSYIGIEIADALKYIPTPVDGGIAEQEDVKPAKKSRGKAKAAEQENAEDKALQEETALILAKVDEIDDEIEEESEVAEEYDADAEAEDEADDLDVEDGNGTDGEIVDGEDAGDSEDIEEAEDDYEAEVEDADEEYEEDGEAYYEDGEEVEDETYVEETTFEKKPSLWQRIKNSKVVRTINFILKIRVVLDYPALPEPDNN